MGPLFDLGQKKNSWRFVQLRPKSSPPPTLPSSVVGKHHARVGPGRVGPGRVGPEGWRPEGWGPEECGRAQIFALFSLSRHNVLSFSLSWGSLREILVVFLNTFGVLGLSCGVSHDSPRAQTCAFQGPGASNTTKIPRKDPQEREERMKIVAGGKKSEILGGPAEGRSGGAPKSWTNTQHCRHTHSRHNTQQTHTHSRHTHTQQTQQNTTTHRHTHRHTHTTHTGLSRQKKSGHPKLA